MGLFGNKKKTEVVRIDSSLIILMEAPKSGVIRYFNSMGIKVEALIYNIDDLRYALMDICEYHRRLVIVENGLGIFSKTENRDSLVDILGLVNNIALDATVVYTDSGMAEYIRKKMKAIAKESGSELSKIDYIPFENMMSVYKALSEYNENYIVSGADDEVDDDAMGFVAHKVDIMKNYYARDFKDSSILNDFDVGDDGKEVSLIQYKIKI